MMESETSGNLPGPSENQPTGGVPPAVLSGLADAIHRVMQEEVAAAQAASKPVGGPTPPHQSVSCCFHDFTRQWGIVVCRYHHPTLTNLDWVRTHFNFTEGLAPKPPAGGSPTQWAA